MMATNVQYDKNTIKALLNSELNDYLELIGDITENEKKELKEWVADGNSVHNNPFLLYEESGSPMDFINGCRIGIDMKENPSNYSIGEPIEFDDCWCLDDISSFL
jgi:hypothetical protein